MLKGHVGPITSIAWEPLHQCGASDGACTRFATSSKDGTVRVWNAVLKRVIYVLSQHTAPVMCVKWGGNGQIYTASRDKTIKVWNAADGTLVKSLKGHAHWINSIALSNEHLLRTGYFHVTTYFLELSLLMPV
jgi:ribosome assembly protein 4